MAGKFKTGDIVQLKSGGPEMTVKGPKWDPLKGIWDEDQLICTWFDDNNTQNQDLFHPDMLEAASDETDLDDDF